jgi:archaellum biogenesis ATPase FlaH
MKYRENFLMTFIGHNRTGKTVIAKEIAKEWKKTHNGEIIVFDPQHRFTDILDVEIKEDNENWANELYESKPLNSLVIFDDYKMLMDNDRTPKKFLSLLAARNEWCTDVIMITHHPRLLLERASYYVTHYFVFYTQADDKAFSRNIINVQDIIDVKNAVNAEVLKNGRGTYERKNFPYAIYVQDEGTAQFVNFKG